MKYENVLCWLVFGCVLAIACNDGEEQFTGADELDASTAQQAVELEGVPLAPPVVESAHECGEVVLVSGVIDGAEARLFVDGDAVDVAPGDTSGHAELDVPELEEGQELTAIQFTDDQSSEMSSARLVESIPETLPKPVFAYDIWECGRKVMSQGQIPNLTMRAHQNGNVIAEEETSDRWRNDKWPLRVDPLDPPGDEVTLDIVACPDSEKEVVGPMSEPREISERPDPMEPVGDLIAYPAEDRLRVKETYVGAVHRKSKNNDQLLLNLAKFDDYYNYFFSEGSMDESDDFGVQNRLCEAGGSTTAEVVPPEDSESGLSNVRIQEPVCPNATVVIVRSSVPSGVVVLYHEGDPALRAPVTGHATPVDVASLDLQDGDELQVQQFLPDANMEGDVSPSVEVSEDGEELMVTGGKNYKDQISDEEIQGFVRDGDQKDQGPEIEFSCCADCDCHGCEEVGYQCHDGDGPREATAEIVLFGETIDEVTLVEEEIGFYRGRWDWLDEEFDSSLLPASHEYKVRIQGTPCGETDAEEYFEVLIGEGAETGAPPNSVELSAEDQFGNSATVTGDGSNESLVVSSSSSFSVTAQGLDRYDALESLRIEGDGSAVNLGKDELEVDNEAPVPYFLEIDTTQSRLEPGEVIQLTAEARNWGNATTETAILEIEGGAPEHETPMIQQITPSYPHVDGEITIFGEHLFYPGNPDMETEVIFEATSSSAPTEVVDPQAAGSGVSSDELTDVPIPDSWDNYDLEGEEVEVRVRTDYDNGSSIEESSPFAFTFVVPCPSSGVVSKALYSPDNVVGEFVMFYERSFFESFHLLEEPCLDEPPVITAVENPDWGMLDPNADCAVELHVIERDDESGVVLDSVTYNSLFDPGVTYAITPTWIQASPGPNSTAYWHAVVHGAYCPNSGDYDQGSVTLNFHWEAQ